MLPLLRFLNAQTGQATMQIGLIGVTFICLVWSVTLFAGVDLQPGLQSLSQTIEPLREGIDTVYEITAPARRHIWGLIEG